MSSMGAIFYDRKDITVLVLERERVKIESYRKPFQWIKYKYITMAGSKHPRVHEDELIAKYTDGVYRLTVLARMDLYLSTDASYEIARLWKDNELKMTHIPGKDANDER